MILLILLQLGAIGLGAYLVLWAINFQKSSVAPFVSLEFFIGALALGGLIAANALYGVIAPLSCRGQKDDHLKIFYVISLLLLLAFAVFGLLALLNSGDAENLLATLDYGWQKAFAKTEGQGKIAAAQIAGACCGFVSTADRPVNPCPSGAKDGCKTFLAAQLKKELGFVGLLFFAGAGACLLLMAIAHGYIERVNFDRQKQASSSMEQYAGLDAKRDKKIPSGKSASSMASRTQNQSKSTLPPTGARAVAAGGGGLYDSDAAYAGEENDEPSESAPLNGGGSFAGGSSGASGSVSGSDRTGTVTSRKRQ